MLRRAGVLHVIESATAGNPSPGTLSRRPRGDTGELILTTSITRIALAPLPNRDLVRSAAPERAPAARTISAWTAASSAGPMTWDRARGERLPKCHRRAGSRVGTVAELPGQGRSPAGDDGAADRGGARSGLRRPSHAGSAAQQALHERGCPCACRCKQSALAPCHASR